MATRSCFQALCIALVAVLLLACALPATAAELARFAKDVAISELFPGADRVGAPTGALPVAPVFAGDDEVGVLFLNSDFVNTTGYSGKPIHVLVAMDRNAIIRGAKLVEHHEPIVLIGIPQHKIDAVIDHYAGVDVAALATAGRGERKLDIVSGATVTIMVIDDSIVRSAIKVARAGGFGGLAAPEQTATRTARLVDDGDGPQSDWIGLVGDGSVRRLKVSVEAVNEAFERSGDDEAASRPETGAPDETFIELFAAQVSLPTIGRSVLGEAEYRNLVKRLQPDQHAIVIAARGRYSFKGSGYVRGGIFDRFQVIQRDISIRFHDRDHKRLRDVVAVGAPDFDEVDLFVIDPKIAFDPTASWTLELLVSRETGPTRKAFVTFALDYRVPEHFVQVEAPAPASVVATPQQLEQATQPPLWPTLWRHKRWEVVALIAALTLLTGIFFFQNWFTRRPVLIERLRVGFLLFTLIGIGFYANAQLSVVNILTVFSALVSGFDWTYFLMEPLVFVLWGSVAVSLLFWGRGAFCGWLCPFGALQELVNRLARAMRIRQIRVPWALHERLWPIKYILFLGLFGVSLHSLELAERLAEVEPFKTAIILKFQRAWPYVAFAVVLVLASVFIERFYCRYLCALGAALAIPGRLRTFDWLKRYRQCGAPCQQCATGCMVQAIHPEGNINPNECLYCLHCQVLYFDDKRCPVMVQRRIKRERRESRLSEGSKEELERIVSELQRDRAARRAAEDN